MDTAINDSSSGGDMEDPIAVIAKGQNANKKHRRKLFLWIVCSAACLYPFVWEYLSEIMHMQQGYLESVPKGLSLAEASASGKNALRGLVAALSSSSSRTASLKRPFQKQPVDLSNYDENIFLDALEAGGCQVLENVCISHEQEGLWFYKEALKNEKRRKKRQPEFMIYTTWERIDAKKPKQIPWINITHNYQPPSGSNNPNTTMSDTELCDMDTNQTAKTVPRNRIIVTSTFLTMMMDFYIRVLAGMWELYQDAASRNTTLDILKGVNQYYVHVQNKLPNRELIRGAHPLMTTLSDWPLLSLPDLLDHAQDTCHPEPYSCMPRLVFCGYLPTTDVDVNKRHGDLKRVVDDLREQKDAVLMPNAQLKRTKQPMNWSGLRNDVRSEVVDKTEDTTLREEILHFKERAVFDLLHKARWDPDHPLYRVRNNTATDAWIQNQVTHHLEEYTLIGMSQRGSRRWMNLDETLAQCSKSFLATYKVACVEVNLDRTSNHFGSIHHAYKDVVMHAGLDALIGIHGSQQTNAVYLPHGAYELELLPHLNGNGGGWTQATHSHTCNGLMTLNSTIHHLGYPLTKSGAADCMDRYAHVADCRNKTPWNHNDFTVDWHIVDNFVRTFLLGQEPQQRDEHGLVMARQQEDEDQLLEDYHAVAASTVKRTCDFFDDRAHNDFVLYNVQCYNKNFTQVENRQYFRPRDSFEHLTRAS
jgi:hypothetical protein